ncbi:MAG: hypothetical protein HY462_01465, partial [Parcubacteria group bacterium]|nr:hypothetical protein [Parcubacteria group bacterium]
MALTRRQLKRAKQLLLVAGVMFAIQLGVPQVSLAAQENYHALANGEPAQFSHTLAGPELAVPTEEVIIDRQEKLVAQLPDEVSVLPLEGPPRAVAERWLTVTAYSSDPWQTDGTPFTTAWMTPVRDGVVALNFLPKGSMVR